MKHRKFRGISFDLWDTAVSDTTPVRERRQNRRLELVAAYGKDRSAQLAALERKHPEEFATQGAKTLGMQIELRARLLLAELGGPPEDVPVLAAALSESALLEPPTLAQGLTQVLGGLVSKIPLVIISNTSWTSGTTTRALLAKTHLAAYMSYLASSDEVGWAKPSPLIFEAAWRSLRIDPADTVHVGDNLKRDHAGATAVGATSVISRVLRKIREPGETQADAICWDYADLPFLLSYLETGQLPDEWELLARGVPVWGTVVAARSRAIRTPDMVVPPDTVAAPHNGEYSLSLFRSAAAILTETGDGETAAQMARSCDTTCVVGLNRIGAILNDGDRIIIDGKRGLVWRHCEARLRSAGS